MPVLSEYTGPEADDLPLSETDVAVNMVGGLDCRMRDGTYQQLFKEQQLQDLDKKLASSMVIFIHFILDMMVGLYHI